MQSGKPVGVFRTHADAPRVLIANSNLVPHWATWEHFNELDRKGLMMYGQMTAGSWIYIGSQGIVQGTYETFVEVGRQHYGGDLAGQLDPDRRPRRHGRRAAAGRDDGRRLAARRSSASRAASRCACETRYLDAQADDLDEALAMIERACRGEEAASRSACSATPPRSCPSWCAAACGPTCVTDQTSAHDPVNGYLPKGWTLARVGGAARARSARRSSAPPSESMASHVRAMLDFHAPGVPTVDYGNNIRQMAKDEGVADAFDFPGFVPAYIRPLFCRGIGPFRWAALSGDPEDIYKTDAKVKELLPDDAHLHHWLDMARERIAFQGLPARICWVGLGERHRLGLAFNEMVAQRRAEGADRDRPRPPRLRLGRAPEPRDRGDARRLRRRVRLAAAQRAAQHAPRGATWVSLHHGGGVGMGYSQHAGMVIVCDGTPRPRRSASSACCGTTRRPASCATPMPATRTRSRAPEEHGLRLPSLDLGGETAGSAAAAWTGSIKPKLPEPA